MSSNDKFLTAKVKLHNYRFPKNKVHVSGEYAIVLLEVTEIIEGEVPNDCWTSYGDHTIIVTGAMPKLEKGVEYLMQGVLKRDAKWGAQFSCENIRLDYDMSNRKDQEKFLSYILTDNQIAMLYEQFEDPISILKNNDIESLTKIKGIGPVTASRLCMRYADNINNGRAYVELKGLGITKNAIDRMVKQFGSADVLVDLIKSNPYNLIKLVRGYGWEKADKIAQAQGFTPNCKERIIAYAHYRLERNADEGNSCMSIGELVTEIVTVCAPIHENDVKCYLKENMVGQNDFNELYTRICEGEKDLKFPTFFYSSENQKVGLFYHRLIERKILGGLQRLSETKTKMVFDKDVCEKIIKEVETEQGYQYTLEQRKAIWSMLNNNVSILTGPAGCVDCDTEFFTGYEWKKISQYQPGDNVLIYHEDGSATLEQPSNYIKLPCDQLWLTQTKYGIDMCTCDEHNVYYITSKNNLHHTSFAKVKEMHENSVGGFSGKFITSFNGGKQGINLSDVEIKIMLAVIADGSFSSRDMSKPTTYCRFHIKKERKKVELRRLFTEANMQWKETESAAPGYTDFYIYAPRKEKVFSQDWYNCSHEQLQLICNNVLQWDGSVSKGRRIFSSNVKENADFIQYAFTACGYKATILTRDRSGQEYCTNNTIYIRKSIEYTVLITDRSLVSIGGFHRGNTSKTQIVPYKAVDGFKYCFTVSTHMWVMRRNGKIVITGNCGKSSTVKPLIKVFEHYNLVVSQTALSGRAASLLTSYTGLEGKTIHRLLCYSPELEQFTKDASHPLDSDVVILDETSMVGEELFLDLISAIRSGSRLIMLGDIKQLPPISVGNILSDCMSSGYIPTNVLTKIHRQALMSGIISQSFSVSEGKSIVRNDFLGEEIRGELKDFKIIGHNDATLVHTKALNEFKELLGKGVSSDNIQIIVPVRARGMNSCRFFNAEVQQLVNPDHGKGVTVEVIDKGMKYEVVYRPGDKIMILQNNYHARSIYGKEVEIFNGNMGHIVDVDPESMIIDLEEQGRIILDRGSWNTIIHGWACTCHKLQGSQSEYAIICLDNSAYTLLIREWLYTAITRAKKYCVLVGQPRAINSAIRSSNIKIKQTWLRKDLQDLFISSQQ